MCMGIPMRVQTIEPGWAVVEGRGERRRARTVLVGEPALGEWVLVHIDSVVERLSAERAAEINEALDLVAAALVGSDAAGNAIEFSLPSAMSAADLAALTGHSTPSPKGH